MRLRDVMEWLQGFSARAENYYCGILDGKKDKSIGVYQLRNTAGANIAIGGRANTKTLFKSVSLLVHWNHNSDETETFAQKLYDEIEAVRNVTIGGKLVDYIELLQFEPVDVGTDDNGVFERVIECVIYYQKESE